MGQVAMSVTGKLYCWGATPQVLKSALHVQRKMRNAGDNNQTSQGIDHLSPTAVDCQGIQGHIKQVKTCIEILDRRY